MLYFLSSYQKDSHWIPIFGLITLQNLFTAAFWRFLVIRNYLQEDGSVLEVLLVVLPLVESHILILVSGLKAFRWIKDTLSSFWFDWMLWSWSDLCLRNIYGGRNNGLEFPLDVDKNSSEKVLKLFPDWYSCFSTFCFLCTTWNKGILKTRHWWIHSFCSLSSCKVNLCSLKYMLQYPAHKAV